MADHPRDLLAAAAAGMLDDDEQRAVDAHLPGCQPCTDELGEWQRIGRAVRVAESIDVLEHHLQRRRARPSGGGDG